MRKTSAPARGWKHRCARARVVRRRRRQLKWSALLVECQRLESFVRQDRRVHNCPGVAPRTGNGLPGGVGDEVAEGNGAGAAPEDFGEAGGEAEAPGCVDGCTAGGFIAAAGCPRASEFGPATEVGFGVPLDCGEDDGAGDAVAAPPGAAEDSGAAIAYAGAGFLLARSATVNSIARSIGNRTVPLVLSTQA